MSFAGTARSGAFICLNLTAPCSRIFVEKIFEGLDVRSSLLSIHDQLVISTQRKVRPDENDGIKLSATMGGLDDASDIVQLLGTLEGP
jgi:hypothetical protein